MSIFIRRSFICRYIIVLLFVVYLISIALFIPSSSLKTREFTDPAPALTEPSTVTTRNHSVPVSVPAAAPVVPHVDVAAVSTRSTKKPTALEDLHKNMTLHKANMSDIRKHVEAAVANRSDNKRKVCCVHDLTTLGA